MSAYELELASGPMWMIWWVFDQENGVVKVFRHLGEASHSQAVGLLNTPICAGWATERDTSSPGGFFPVCSNDSFLTQVIENLLCTIPYKQGRTGGG